MKIVPADAMGDFLSPVVAELVEQDAGFGLSVIGQQ
jgi:hypothetical protein